MLNVKHYFSPKKIFGTRACTRPLASISCRTWRSPLPQACFLHPCSRALSTLPLSLSSSSIYIHTNHALLQTVTTGLFSSFHRFFFLYPPPSSVAVCHWRRLLSNRLWGCQSIRGYSRPAVAVILSLPPPFRLSPFFFFFFSIHCVKVKQKKQKPLYRVGWKRWEVGIFPQWEVCDWWSESPLTASWLLIG